MRRNPRNNRSRKKTPRTQSHHRFSSLTRTIFTLLYETSAALQKQKLAALLTNRGFSADEIHDEIRQLVSNGYLSTSGKNRLQPGPGCDIYQGVLEMTTAGFGFVTNLTTTAGKPADRNDLYIHRTALLNARHGDTVLALAVPGRSGRRPEGRILEIVGRSTRTIIGFVVHERSRLIVYPEDPRFPFTIEVRTSADTSAVPQPGEAVVVKLVDQKSSGQTLQGEILEILGDPARIEVLTKMMAEKYQLPYHFSPEAAAEAEHETLPDTVRNREDLREILHVTIDGEDAKDFDDAVAVQKTRNGYRLYISIADVSAFVESGSQLDIEAYERGTSVYFPGAVIPMLPENLSNNLCSLVPDEDRLTVTAILDFDRDGVMRKKRFTRSLIRSHMRFTYDTVKLIAIDKDAEARRSFKPFLTPLKWAIELAELLLKQRKKRGSITLNLAEANICIENGDTVASVTRRSRHFAHQLIEEFMLAANEAVALAFDEHNVPALYRTHEEPDPEKVAEFIAMSRILGLELPGTAATPKWYSDLVRQAADTDREFIINSLLLRTMQQARYSDRNSGHFGLGASHYTHFTSPIRRYPDLIVHRQLCRLIHSEGSKKTIPGKRPYQSLHEAGLQLSVRERQAITAEREMMDKLKCRYMQDKTGERYSAIISSLTDSLMYVELVDHLISGAIPLSDLTDDYYLHDSRRYRLIGDINGKIYQIGDEITVQVTEVDLSRNKIFFAPVFV